MVIAISGPILPALGVQWRALRTIDSGSLFSTCIMFGIAGVAMIVVSFLPAMIVKWGMRAIGLLIVVLLGLTLYMITFHSPEQVRARRQAARQLEDDRVFGEARRRSSEASQRESMRVTPPAVALVIEIIPGSSPNSAVITRSAAPPNVVWPAG